jgi:hypothetical protein
VIDYSTEGYWDIDWKFLEAIFGVNEDRMIWLTSLYNFSDVTNKDEPHKSVSIATTSAEVKYNPLWERMVFGMIRANFEGIKRQLTLIESSQARPSKSMLYNRRPHLHRIALLSKMKYHNELNRMIWSWGGILCDDDEIITNARKQKEIKNVGYDSGVLLDEKYKEIFEEILRTPLHSDNEDITTNKAGDMNFRHVHQTYFQVLTETLFQQPGIFLSEKSYKPFLSCQPFVLCGQTGTVNVLREQGYDVYDDWIDHSYDTILDDTERLDALSMEVRRLNQITDDDWVDMLKEMLPTIKKNLLHLVDSGDKVDVITFDHSVSDTPMPVFDL